MLERAGLRAPLHRRPRPRAVAECRARSPKRQAWIEQYRRFWEGRLAALDAYVTRKTKETQMKRRPIAGLRRRRRPPHHRRLRRRSVRCLARSGCAGRHGCGPAPSSSTVATVEPRVGGALRNHHAGRFRRDPAQAACTGSSIARGAWCSPGTRRPPDRTESLVTVDFVPLRRGTEVIVTHEQLPESARQSHRTAGPAASSISTRPVTKDSRVSA